MSAKEVSKETDDVPGDGRPVWEAHQIDQLGARLTDAEIAELKEVEAQRDQPDYMQRVDELIASKMVAYGIATYSQIFPGEQFPPACRGKAQTCLACRHTVQDHWLHAELCGAGRVSPAPGNALPKPSKDVEIEVKEAAEALKSLGSSLSAGDFKLVRCLNDFTNMAFLFQTG